MEKYHGNTVEYWKQNAEEDYSTTPISVLKYITVLEEQVEQLRKQAVVAQGEQLVCQESKLDCPYDFTSRCTLGRCDCKPKAN